MFEIKFLNFSILLLGPLLMIKQFVKMLKIKKIKIILFIVFSFSYMFILMKELYKESVSMEAFKT